MTTLTGLESTKQSDFISTQASSTTKKQITKLGKDEFLKLLMAQLKNQDPLNPLDSTQFTSQLAQFNSLEQLMQVNDNLAEIKNSVSIQNKENPLDYIGKKVKAAGNTISLKDHIAEAGSYRLDEGAQVSISIYNSQGQEVRRLDGGWLSKGEHGLTWDGKDNAGRELADGDYTFQILAKNANGASVSVDGYLSGEVTGVTYQNDEPVLMVGNRSIKQQSVIEVTK